MQLPLLKGPGLGLRSEHQNAILTGHPKARWFEAVSENYLAFEGLGAGPARKHLENIRTRFPIALHGVSLSIGGTDPLNRRYLEKLKELAHEIEASIVSDHLCFTGTDGINLHDLLPLPYTRETIDHVCNRIDFVQNFLGSELVLENVSSYIQYQDSEMSEWEFIREIIVRTQCGVLLDVNNVYVSSVNHCFDPVVYLQAIPARAVRQIHLAGHTRNGDLIIDTHIGKVSDPVWNLYEDAIRLFGDIPTMIEWDSEIPEYPVLENEMLLSDEIQRKVLNELRTGQAHPTTKEPHKAHPQFKL